MIGLASRSVAQMSKQVSLSLRGVFSSYAFAIQKALRPIPKDGAALQNHASPILVQTP